MRVLLAVLLIAHGLIVSAQSVGCFVAGSYVANPAWLRWWPTALGQSWLLAALRAERGAPAALAGAIWLLGGLALVAAGLGLLGVLMPPAWWRALALAGGVASLGMLLIYFHPFLSVGVVASALLAAGLLWMAGPWLSTMGA